MDIRPLNPEAEIRRRESLQRLATAAALETCAGYGLNQAWDLAKGLPEQIRLNICAAARDPISASAKASVRRILTVWRRQPLSARPS